MDKKRALAVRLMEINTADDPTFASLIEKDHPDYEIEIKHASCKDDITREAWIRVYLKYFSEEELSELIQSCDTPVMRKLYGLAKEMWQEVFDTILEGEKVEADRYLAEVIPAMHIRRTTSAQV